jgi:ubiquinone/menaquinone biosynthesis C-methylase UbiE
MFIKLDSAVLELLCCPLCKGELRFEKEALVCGECATQYPRRSVNVGGQSESTYDLRIQRPSYCIPKSSQVWKESQTDYEQWSHRQAEEEQLQTYLDEIESVREIYTEEFHVQGSVLDVGGHQGRLRHFLSRDRSPLYVSVDPFLHAFERIREQPNLLKAYPSLSEPCNFLVCRAEELPFVKNAFDWVHMRSVMDHFEDPYRAVKEAYRVLKPDGHLMIGLTIMERFVPPRLGLSTRLKLKYEQEGAAGVLRALGGKVSAALGRPGDSGEKDHHIFRFSHAELRDLLSAAGFAIEKEHWQKPPFNYCLYLAASARKGAVSGGLAGNAADSERAAPSLAGNP